MLYFFVGLLIGLFLSIGILHFRSDGTLLVNDGDERKTLWTLQVKTDPEEVQKKRSIHLRVHVLK